MKLIKDYEPGVHRIASIDVEAIKKCVEIISTRENQTKIGLNALFVELFTTSSAINNENDLDDDDFLINMSSYMATLATLVEWLDPVMERLETILDKGITLYEEKKESK